ncbi:M14 metallopeptidase family protein [Nafulsella turpanensis]|uniref:M14 metallopeptidase family protein n=1 Tax=Nafulsella turpanensis TaxID=1265690 RepID=UPI000349B812|nr:M14 metallopeptidase family protein [Nafulsella turpanensis]
MMKIKVFCLLLSILSISRISLGQEVSLDYYLPQNVSYNPGIPTPASVLGYEVGEWHVSHDKLVEYMKALAAASDRVGLEYYGSTYEQRPLVLLTISAPENLERAEEIKAQRQLLTHPRQEGTVNLEEMPAVVYMGFSIHGNEPSGTNSALLTAYHLAAAQGEDIEKKLEDVVVLLDPSFNPDGMNRFASWVNSHRGKNLSIDPFNREQNEAWPRGRTNHYWFDLNRDWLPAQHPESQARLQKFHEWKPNILTDHHEMGTNSTFFFQPGIPSRNNPLTPENTYNLTEAIARYHAQALDSIGSLYYTEEDFDDYYYGKGSTYPDINGAVGILFEQASSRGHAQESENGVLTFPFTIKNQFNTTLSTFQAAYELRDRLLSHQKEFYENALEEADEDKKEAYVFGSSEDPVRAYHLAELINRHDIQIYQPASDLNINNQRFEKESSYVVPLDQPQYRLIKAMFETRTEFQDSLFYDVSTWTLPLSFNLPYAALTGRDAKGVLGQAIETPEFPEGEVKGGQSNYAYLFEWDGYYAPRALQRLFEAGLRPKVSNEPLKTATHAFGRGSILVPVQNQEISADSIFTLMKTIAAEDGIDVYNAASGLTSGISLGSPSFSSLEQPKVALLVEGDVSSYDAGEVWHLLDQRYNMAPTLLPVSSIGVADFSRYNTLIMVDGDYGSIGKQEQDKLKDWLKEGGTIVALQGAGRWLADSGFSEVNYKMDTLNDSLPAQAYGDLWNRRGAQVIGGAIFDATLDLTHPLTYGYNRENIALFRNSEDFIEPAPGGYANPVRYTGDPLLSGYISEPNLEALQNSAAVQVSALGNGRIITFSDNPNFRAFWYGTNKLFMNSIFFGPVISRLSAE